MLVGPDGSAQLVNNLFATMGDGPIDRVEGAASGDHNLSMADPGFMRQTASDFRLKPGSPALGAGVPLAAVRDDFTGAPRLGPVSIGAYQQAADAVMRAPVRQ